MQNSIPSSRLPWSHFTSHHRILPISLLLLFSLSTLPVAFAQEVSLHIDGPDPQTPPQQCGSATFTFSGGVPPYTLEIKYSIDQPPLRLPLNASDDTTFTWSPVDFQEGTELLAEVKDSHHNKAYTDYFKVQSGDDSCPVSVSPSGYQFCLPSDRNSVGNTEHLCIVNNFLYIL